MVGKSFDSYEEVKAFLCECDGKAPSDWAAPDEHQTSAWCAVDLSLLDAFGHAFKQPVFDGSSKADISGLRYSAVISSDTGMKLLKNVLKILLFGMDRVKLKVDGKADGDMYPIKILRGIPGRNMDIRVDANMAWTREQAVARMGEFAKYGVRFFEQPVSTENVDDLSYLEKETGLSVMADESMGDRESLQRLIDHNACRAVNIRISKCGGLMSSLARCTEAKDAGMVLQVGCQVGESSLLSSAQLALISQVPGITFLEGCFGLLLLKQDPVYPLLQFGFGGRPPQRPAGPGLGVRVDEAALKLRAKHTVLIQ
jgi:muconate cycloisomerase